MSKEEKNNWYETRKYIPVGWLTEDEQRFLEGKAVDFVAIHKRAPSSRKELIMDMAQQYKYRE